MAVLLLFQTLVFISFLSFCSSIRNNNKSMSTMSTSKASTASSQKSAVLQSAPKTVTSKSVTIPSNNNSHASKRSNKSKRSPKKSKKVKSEKNDKKDRSALVFDLPKESEREQMTDIPSIDEENPLANKNVQAKLRHFKTEEKPKLATKKMSREKVGATMSTTQAETGKTKLEAVNTKADELTVTVTGTTNTVMTKMEDAPKSAYL